MLDHPFTVAVVRYRPELERVRMMGSTTDQQGSFRLMLNLPVKIRPATTVLREGPCQL